MAVGPRDIKLTREEVGQWLEDYDGEIRDTKKLRTYLDGKIEEKELSARVMDTSSRDDLDGDEWDVVDLIVEDLASYV